MSAAGFLDHHFPHLRPPDLLRPSWFVWTEGGRGRACLFAFWICASLPEKSDGSGSVLLPPSKAGSSFSCHHLSSPCYWRITGTCHTKSLNIIVSPLMIYKMSRSLPFPHIVLPFLYLCYTLLRPAYCHALHQTPILSFLTQAPFTLPSTHTGDFLRDSNKSP